MAGRYADAPPDCGLLVSLDGDGTCWAQFLKDTKLGSTHPNMHVPATVHSLTKLGGGGSGVTVVQGTDTQFGGVVIKHGGHRDTLELCALAEVKEQLQLRGRSLDARAEADDMLAQIPAFRYLYISPHHLRDRGQEWWVFVKDSLGSRQTMSDVVRDALHALRAPTPNTPSANRRRGIRVCCPKHQTDSEKGQPAAPVRVVGGRLEVELGWHAELDAQGPLQASEPGKGYAYLQSIVEHVVDIQIYRLWKISLAQKTIGGADPETGAAILARGRMEGGTLRTLIAGVIRVMHNVQRLTLPHESSGIQGVRQELASLALRKFPQPTDVSNATDAFVGLAVMKNFHPVTGRFRKLREAGKVFRSGELVLTKAEELPAELLGTVLQAGAQIETVFETELAGPTALDTHFAVWHDLLKAAASLEGDAATSTVWTSGLADGGLHNLFVGEDRLWFFDMGKPQLMSLPAVLTKLLMSFFHTLGMEEEAGTGGGWVNRFEQGRPLRLTAATAALLPSVSDAFRVSRDAFVQELFGGEAAVSALLVRYAALQLLSDAAFSLERWATKGGGSQRLRPEAQRLEQWLWRALWDLYSATRLASWEEWPLQRPDGQVVGA